MPTGVNFNRYSGPSSCIRWHSDNEPLFGAQNSPTLIVSMSLGNSVEFKVRRGRGSVPSLITLDHGDLLVMDGLTQSEYVHCTASGLQGPRVNLMFRWVAQHIASCPLAGAVGCVLPSCVQGLAELGPQGEGGWGNKWSSFWGLMLRVRKSLDGAGGCASGWLAAENDSGGQQVKPVSGTNKDDVGFSRASSARRGAGWSAAENDSEDQQVKLASAGESKGTIELHEVKESVTSTTGDRGLLDKFESEFSKNLAECAASSRRSCSAHATAGESDGTIGFCRLSLKASGCVAAAACARLPAVPGLSAAAPSSPFSPVSGFSSSAVSAVVAHARSTPMHDACNSCSDTAMNSLRDQRCRKVRSSRTVGIRSVEQTVDMSPAPAAGTYRRSAGTMHAQRQVPRECLAECSGVCPGPGPGPDVGGRSGRGGGVSGLAAACLEIPCALVMPPGRHQFAPQSLGWARVCGTGKSGIWMLKGDARTCNLPRNLDDVGVVWEPRSGYETAWATPGHVCSCSYRYGRGPVLPHSNPSVFTEAVNLWSRVASLLTPWCAKGKVPTGVNLNRYSGNGSFIPWHCDNERLFGSPFEPKVIVSMSLGHSALFKLRRRAPENTPSQIRLDHGDLLVMDGLTQLEYEHSTAFELEGPRVNLTFRWISQHI